MDFVPDAPYRLNELITQLLLELVPQVADVHHNRIIGDVIFLLPDLLENILGAKDSPRLAGKQMNFEFSCRQRDRFAIGRYFMCCPVNVEPVDLDPVAEAVRHCTGWSAASVLTRVVSSSGLNGLII